MRPDSVLQQREDELGPRQLLVARTLECEAVEYEVDVPPFSAVVLGISGIAIVFATIAWRFDDGEPVSELAVN